MDYHNSSLSPQQVREAARNAKYRDTLKSSDTEEHIDLAFYRPIGYMWARIAAALGITPNAITIASIFLGIGAGITFYFNNLWINILGMFLLVWANSFDSADGQLARITKQYSQLGRILDGMAGFFWFTTIYIAICMREVNSTDVFHLHHWLLWIAALGAGICHSKHTAVADYYRQFHLYFLKGEDGSELESAYSVKRKFKELSWKKNFVRKIILWSYMTYTINQEQMTPAMQLLRRTLLQKYGRASAIPIAFRREFRRLSLPLMKYTNFLTFNWRTIFLFITLFIGSPWIYFIIELTLFNAVLIYTMIRHERLCRKLAAQLQN